MGSQGQWRVRVAFLHILLVFLVRMRGAGLEELRVSTRQERIGFPLTNSLITLYCTTISSLYHWTSSRLGVMRPVCFTSLPAQSKPDQLLGTPHPAGCRIVAPSCSG